MIDWKILAFIYIILILAALVTVRKMLQRNAAVYAQEEKEYEEAAAFINKQETELFAKIKKERAEGKRKPVRYVPRRERGRRNIPSQHRARAEDGTIEKVSDVILGAAIYNELVNDSNTSYDSGSSSNDH